MELGFKEKGREVIGGGGSYELKESSALYEGFCGKPKNLTASPSITHRRLAQLFP